MLWNIIKKNLGLMNWYKNIKFASSMYMYHGTGIQNMSSILSEGLVPGKELLYDNELDYGSIRSYGGSYLTNNLVTALSSARKSSRKVKEEDKNCIIMVKVESRTPHVVLDEDIFIEPGSCIQRATGLTLDSSSFPEHMAYFITSDLQNKMDQIIDCYFKMISYKFQGIDERILNGLKPYVADLIQKDCIRLLAKQIQTYYQSTWYQSQRKYFDEKFPQFANLDVSQAEQQYRESADFLIQKGHRLTEYSKELWQTNYRSLEPISFKGKNKVVLISEFKENRAYDEYYKEIDILYLSDPNCVSKYISDIQERLGDNFIMKYGNEIFYEKKEEKQLEMV